MSWLRGGGMSVHKLYHHLFMPTCSPGLFPFLLLSERPLSLLFMVGQVQCFPLVVVLCVLADTVTVWCWVSSSEM